MGRGVGAVHARVSRLNSLVSSHICELDCPSQGSRPVSHYSSWLRRPFLVWSIPFALALGVVTPSCGDSTPTPTPAPDEPDAGASDDACDPEGAGACENDNDCPRVEDGQARMSASSCQLSCSASSEGFPASVDDDPSCQTDCVALGAGISSDCAECYVARVACALERCGNACLADAEGRACLDCQTQQGCLAEFTLCSGASYGL